MKIIIKVPNYSLDIGIDATLPDIPMHYIPLDETEYTLDIPLRTRIETLKCIIRDRENLPIIPDPGIGIVYQGSRIEHGSLLDYDNINENSVLHIHFRMRGYF